MERAQSFDGYRLSILQGLFYEVRQVGQYSFYITFAPARPVSDSFCQYVFGHPTSGLQCTLHGIIQLFCTFLSLEEFLSYQVNHSHSLYVFLITTFDIFPLFLPCKRWHLL